MRLLTKHEAYLKIVDRIEKLAKKGMEKAKKGENIEEIWLEILDLCDLSEQITGMRPPIYEERMLH